MDELAAFGRKLSKLEDAEVFHRMAAKAGAAGKKAAIEAASRSLGGDRRFSGLRRGAALNAGYDAVDASSVQINFRPAGLWVLAEDGRRASGAIFPRGGVRKGSRSTFKRAVRTPQGLRSRSSYGPSRGLNTFSKAVDAAQRDVPDAAAKQFTDEIVRILR